MYPLSSKKQKQVRIDLYSLGQNFLDLCMLMQNCINCQLANIMPTKKCHVNDEVYYSGEKIICPHPHQLWLFVTVIKTDYMIKGHSNLKCNLTFIVIYLISVYYINLTCFNRWQLYFSSKFNVSQCDNSLAPGFILINTWQQRAVMPFKPAQGHHLQVKISSLMFYGEMTKLFHLP